VTLHPIEGDPGDWGGTVTEDITSGVPELEELVGLPWPDWKPLDVVEVADDELDGYAGMYLESLHAIQVPRHTDQATMLHEMGHAWFNDSVFSDPWVSEGLAELFSYESESN